MLFRHHLNNLVDRSLESQGGRKNGAIGCVLQPAGLHRDGVRQQGVQEERAAWIAEHHAAWKGGCGSVLDQNFRIGLAIKLNCELEPLELVV